MPVSSTVSAYAEMFAPAAVQVEPPSVLVRTAGSSVESPYRVPSGPAVRAWKSFSLVYAMGDQVWPASSLRMMPRCGDPHSAGVFAPGWPDATKASLVVHHQRVLRNKECALFYLRERLEVLTRLRCEAGSNLPRNVRRHCSPQESQFNAAYDQLYQDFCRASRLDPRDSLKPPRDLYVEVRCNVDCGDVQTKHSGTVRMDKGTSHFLRRADVEQLIAQGLVTHVTTGVAP